MQVFKSCVRPGRKHGQVEKATVKRNGETIYICDECEAIWFTNEIRYATFNYFNPYMERLNLPANWSELQF